VKVNPPHHSASQRTARRFIIGFGWWTVAAAGLALIVGSAAVTVVTAWVQLGQQASDLNGPDVAATPSAFFADAFRNEFGAVTLPSLLAVCGIVLFLIGCVQGIRRLIKR
jgi:hypothetical protein